MALRNIITVPITALPKGDYARHVVQRGHQPGVLSGAELKGRAKSFGAWYASRRRDIHLAVEPFGLTSEVILIPETGRRTRVWIEAATGMRAEAVIDFNA